MICPTTSGPFRCTTGDAGHEGPCETQAPEYATALDKRVRVLEEQVRSLQMSMPRGIPR